MTLLSLLHVSTGVVAIGSGALALLSSKGSERHKTAGRWFVVSMAAASLLGALIAYFVDQALTLLVGLFSVYLLATALLTTHRRPKTTGPADSLLCVIGLAIGALGAGWGFEAMQADDGLKDGFAAALYWFFSGLAFTTGLADLVVINRGGVAGSIRLCRHLWRACFAMFIAVGSLFTGPGMVVFPEALQASGVLSLPEAMVFLTMCYHLVRQWWQARAQRPS